MNVLPTFDQLMLPLLRLSADGEAHTLREAVTVLADYLRLSGPERDATLASGRRQFDDRVRGAVTYLRKALLLQRTGRGMFKITQRGLWVLSQSPAHIDTAYLKQFPEFEAYLIEARTRRDRDFDLLNRQTPRAQIDTSYENLRVDLAEDLLEKILGASPEFFEQLVIDLLLAMGYGGDDKTGYVLGRSGDGGVDGYIQEDKLGLDKIYVQAKRYARANAVGRPLVQAFVGSLMGLGAARGVFLTTSRFSDEALGYANDVKHAKIILIDGKRLTQLMIDHNVGVNVEKTYVIKAVDTDYFDVST